MKNSLNRIIALAIAISCCVSCSSPENTAAKQAALESTTQWLSLVDAGKYDESWKQGASILQGLVRQEDWAQLLRELRENNGRAVSREVKATEYATSVPGAPDGDYVRIQYDTSFEKTKVAVEQVIQMLDFDGEWRVAGYQINPALIEAPHSDESAPGT